MRMLYELGSIDNVYFISGGPSRARRSVIHRLGQVNVFLRSSPLALVIFLLRGSFLGTHVWSAQLGSASLAIMGGIYCNYACCQSNELPG